MILLTVSMVDCNCCDSDKPIFENTFSFILSPSLNVRD
jgi:hypothetical protein